jgi:hypothetical protein
MVEISKAHDVLKSPDERAAYDKSAEPKTFSVVPPRVDFGSFILGESPFRRVEILTGDLISEFDFSGVEGPGWRAEVVPNGVIGCVMTVTFHATPRSAGGISSSMSISVPGFEVTVPITGRATTPVKQDQGGSASQQGPKVGATPPPGTSSATRQGTPARPATPKPPLDPGAWSPQYRRFALWGVVAFAFVGLYGAGNAGASVGSSHLSSALLPFIQYGAVALDALIVGLLAWKTKWFTRGGTPLKVAAGVVAAIGWVGVAGVFVVVVVVVLLIAAVLAIVSALLGG